MISLTPLTWWRDYASPGSTATFASEDFKKAQVKRDMIMEKVRRQKQKKRGEKRLGIFQGIISNEEIERDKEKCREGDERGARNHKDKSE
ncbi:hypothetical protein BO83DRAFT_172101 [Aspergillus eucalypticola CBS 122712]|uniref:Uncharacterized protein n=1 Tax=Aspergillus eucalypticola (strain CBS 122712 / IBT 29274) TaxID=1448314 RepID=A0A317W581_ASPEC|nr:uncharacterized protein BO83DRAFT_172101 [Aspergillus eucalypticola CBS 122712]PWY81219.1 hypothetical protein BO83DRAFT_172101 [Aspergillus eucalypticola CBS 122712]